MHACGLTRRCGWGRGGARSCAPTVRRQRRPRRADRGVVVSIGCFCTNCRKISGSQYGVYLQVRRNGFRWVSGDDHTIVYESSPGNKRAFCRTCGSVAPISTSYGAVRVPGGALDDDPGVVPEVILFAESKAGWCAVDGASQTFADVGPQEFWSGIVRRLYASD